MSQTSAILKELAALYPDAGPELNFSNPFETLVATMLSAQCTDKQVNKVTAVLFTKIRSPRDALKLSQEQLEQEIRGCGVFRNKAKNILATCRILEDEYGGEVPATLEELVRLPGVGRKTANVVYANAFGGDAIAVDTHVFRVSNRLGIAHAKNVEDTEEQLMRAIPKNLWSVAHHWLIWHGRRVCHARGPKCATCTLRPYCAYASAQAIQGNI